MDISDWENFSLWVYNEAGRLVHCGNYDTREEAEQALHEQNSYAGGEGRLFKLYHKPRGAHRYVLLSRTDTRRPPKEEVALG